MCFQPASNTINRHQTLSIDISRHQKHIIYQNNSGLQNFIHYFQNPHLLDFGGSWLKLRITKDLLCTYVLSRKHLIAQPTCFNYVLRLLRKCCVFSNARSFQVFMNSILMHTSRLCNSLSSLHICTSAHHLNFYLNYLAGRVSVIFNVLWEAGWRTNDNLSSGKFWKVVKLKRERCWICSTNICR